MLPKLNHSKLRLLDHYLTVWIFLAMGFGVALKHRRLLALSLFQN